MDHYVETCRAQVAATKSVWTTGSFPFSRFCFFCVWVYVSPPLQTFVTWSRLRHVRTKDLCKVMHWIEQVYRDGGTGAAGETEAPTQDILEVIQGTPPDIPVGTAAQLAIIGPMMVSTAAERGWRTAKSRLRFASSAAGFAARIEPQAIAATVDGAVREEMESCMPPLSTHWSRIPLTDEVTVGRGNVVCGTKPSGPTAGFCRVGSRNPHLSSARNANSTHKHPHPPHTHSHTHTLTHSLTPCGQDEATVDALKEALVRAAASKAETFPSIDFDVDALRVALAGISSTGGHMQESIEAEVATT